MRTVQEIINKSGGFSRPKQAKIKIANSPHMPLVIQYLGKSGFNDSDYLRVSQLESVDGKPVRDTEICFETDPDGTNWKPVYWNSDITGKKIYVYTREYETLSEVRQDLFRYIEGFYNRRRMHSYLGYRSPEEFEMTTEAA